MAHILGLVKCCYDECGVFDLSIGCVLVLCTSISVECINENIILYGDVRDYFENQLHHAWLIN